MQVIVSVDHQLKGALAFFSICKGGNYKLIEAYDMPTFINNKKKYINDQEVTRLLKLHKPTHAFTELQFTLNKQSYKGNQTNNFNQVLVNRCIDVLGIKREDIPSTTWKSALNLMNRGRSTKRAKVTKEDSVKLANRLYNLELDLKNDGKADAILIGHYAIKAKKYITKG